MNTINYGISRNYLSHWGINEALREIMQNFMDYGEYKVWDQRPPDGCSIEDPICVSNDYIPKNLEFLALGTSVKKEGSRGQYGEGLKMAMLIFAREGIDIVIHTVNKTIKPVFVDSEIGEVFALEVSDRLLQGNMDNFSVIFNLDVVTWETYYNGIIKKEDIIFDDKYCGRIVDKEIGNIYCGGLFVKKIDNLSKSYDINVAHLPLTRDRNLPQTFDVNWATSMINQSYGKIKITDLTHSDTEYVTEIPIEVKQQIKPRLVGNSIEATYKHKGQDVVIKNESVRNIILKDSFFKRTIKRLRNYLLNKVGVYDMLVQFRDKHVYSTQAKEEFNLILEKLKNE